MTSALLRTHGVFGQFVKRLVSCHHPSSGR